MRTRTLLTSVAAAAIIVATAASFTPEALAQKSAILNPKTGWAVTNVADDAGGSGAYCALARRFTDNLILTMAKNKQSEMSFALDFPGGQFDPERNFSVVLDPGAGQQRKYDVRPASKRAFVVRLGHDIPFFEALQKTGYLRAEVDGQTYNFNLSDIDKGQDKLDSCLTGAMEPKGPQTASGSMTPFPGEAGAGIGEKIAGLESENKSLRSQIEAAQKAGGGPVDLGNSRHEVETLRKENMALNAQMEALKASGQVDPQAQQKLEMLQRENEKLAAIVAASAASDGSAAGILQGLAAENQRLQAALNEKASAFEQGAKEISGNEQAVQDLTERLHVLEAENLSLSQSAKEAKEANKNAGSGDEAQLKVLREQNAELQDRLSAAEVDAMAGDNSGKVASLESAIERMKSKNDILNEQVSALTVALGSGSTSTSRLSDLQSKNDILGRQVEALTTALGSGGRSNVAQVDNLKRQVSDLESINQLLQESLANVHPAAGDDEQIEELKTANQRLQASLDVEKTLKDSHKVTMGHLEARLDTLKGQNEDLKKDIDKARSEALSLNLALEEAMDEKKSLQQRADEAALSQYELSELQGRLDEVKKENVTLTAKLDLIQGSNKESDETHKKEIEALKKDNANIQAALDAAKEDASSKEVKYDAANAELESLKTENETLKAEVMKVASQAEDGQVQRAQIKTLISENERLAKDVAARETELQREIVSLNEVVQNLQQENEKLNNVAISSATNGTIALKKLTEENTRLQAELAIKTKFDENIKENVAVLGSQIDQLQKANETLTMSLENLTGEADSYQALIQEQQEEISTLKLENGDLHQKVAALQDEARVAVDMVSADQDKVIEENNFLVKENLQLKDRLKNFIHKASLEKDEAVSSLISENSRLRDQLHKMSSRDKVVPVSYRAPAAPARKPDMGLLKAVQQQAPGSEDVLQDIAPAAGPDVEADQADEESVSDTAPYQPQPSPREYMNEAQRAEANMKKTLEEGPSDPAPLVPATTPEPVAAPKPVAVHEPQAAPVESVKPHKASMSIHDILKNAGISLTGPVEAVESASKEGITAYQWHAGNLYGSAEQREIIKTSDFDGFTAEYIARTKSRCPGDFAAMTDGATRQDGIRMDSYEVACIGGSVNSTATLLFFEMDGVFTVVAHETDTAHMDMAMEVRDRLIRAIVGTAI